MSWLVGLFAKIPFEWLVGLIAAGALSLMAAIAGFYFWADGNGYHRADLQWQVKWAAREAEWTRQRDDEIERQAHANAIAKAAEAQAIAMLQAEIAARETLIAELEQEAEADPGSDQVALDAEATKRHNRRAGH